MSYKWVQERHQSSTIGIKGLLNVSELDPGAGKVSPMGSVIQIFARRTGRFITGPHWMLMDTKLHEIET